MLEILSDGAWEDDVGDKRDLYARFGVTEYWFYAPEGASGRGRRLARFPFARGRL